MRKLLATGLVAAALVPAASAPASSPVVPLRVQQAIKQRMSPLFAFVPASVPAGYRYTSWMHSRSGPTGLSIWFTWRRARYPGLGFSVSESRCPQVPGMRTYRFGGVKVNWSTTYSDAEAWRCVRRGNHRILFYASAPGYGSKSGPSSLALARVIGLAHPIR